MANTFKNYAGEGTVGGNLLYTIPAATTTVFLGLNLANKSAASVTASVKLGPAKYIPGDTPSFATDYVTPAITSSPTPIAAVGTWLNSIASDGFKYGDLDKSGAIVAADVTLFTALATGQSVTQTVRDRYDLIFLPALIQQSWFKTLTEQGYFVADPAYGAYIIKDAVIPPGSALGVIDGKIIGETAETIIASASGNSAVDVIISVMEQS